MNELYKIYIPYKDNTEQKPDIKVYTNRPICIKVKEHTLFDSFCIKVKLVKTVVFSDTY